MYEDLDQPRGKAASPLKSSSNPTRLERYGIFLRERDEEAREKYQSAIEDDSRSSRGRNTPSSVIVRVLDNINAYGRESGICTSELSRFYEFFPELRP